MLSLRNRVQSLVPCLWPGTSLVRSLRTEGGPFRRRPKSSKFGVNKAEEKSEWWMVDGEMHEIGDHVPPRERFVIPRDNIPNKRRKQLREHFMRRTRLVLKESEHEPWCRKYMELYQELRENWERLYWDENYSKKLAQDHANYESAEDDEQDFSPYRTRRSNIDQAKVQHMGRNRPVDNWEQVNHIRDKFEYDREKRMREKAFAPMHGGLVSDPHNSNRYGQPFDAQRYFPENGRD